MMNRFVVNPIRWGQVGGGIGSEIGHVHRDAARRDNSFQLVAGAFDVDHKRCLALGVEQLGLDESRCYKNLDDMLEGEAKRPDGIQAISITTPNLFHYDMAKKALEANLHVICEKPLTFHADEALELQELAKKKNRVFAVMYGYLGYPIIEQAKEMINRGDIGEIRIVHMQFPIGCFAEEVEKNIPRLQWLLDPKKAGDSYVLADLGTHALQTGLHITGLEIESLSCVRNSFVKSRKLEDDGHVMMKFTNGAVGTLWASAVAVGNTHDFKVEIIGEKGALRWWDEHPNQLAYAPLNESYRLLEKGGNYLYSSARTERVLAGHPEGFLDSWANIFSNIACAIKANEAGEEQPSHCWYPSVNDGVRCVKFIEKCVESSNANSAWVNL